MKTTLVISFLIISTTIFAQQYNLKQQDEKTNSEILIGLCNIKGFMESPFSDWFKREYEDYKPDLEAVKQLKTYAGKYQITVVLGTWCIDSRREVPRFFKIMDLAGYSPNTIKVLCVDSEGIAGDIDIAGLSLKKTPSFIVTISGKEVGRIEETPEKNTETNLCNILKNSNQQK